LRPARVVVCAVLALGVVLSVSLVFPAMGVKYTPGLQTGESAFYSLSGNYGYVLTEPVTQMKVLSVSGTNVSASFSNFFPDGHVSPAIWIDVFSGQGDNSSSNFFFAAASGLQVSDPIFNGWSIMISGQQSLLCGGVSRTVVSTQFFRNGQSVAALWDQSTGALCRYGANGNLGSILLTMTNTTLWGSNTAVDPYVIADIVAVTGLPLVGLVVLVYVRRKRARR